MTDEYKADIADYDKRYRKNPRKWEMPERDALAVEVIKAHAPQPKKILDIGCGNGHTLERFAKAFPDAELYGIDLSTVAVNLAKGRVPKADISAVLLSEFAKTRKRFDVISLLGTAEHFRKLEKELSTVKKLLTVEGIVYMELPYNLAYSVGAKGFRQLSVGSRQWEWHFDKADWENVFKTSGFEIVEYQKGPIPQFGFIWVLR